MEKTFSPNLTVLGPGNGLCESGNPVPPRTCTLYHYLGTPGPAPLATTLAHLGPALLTTTLACLVEWPREHLEAERERGIKSSSQQYPEKVFSLKNAKMLRVFRLHWKTPETKWFVYMGGSRINFPP